MRGFRSFVAVCGCVSSLWLGALGCSGSSTEAARCVTGEVVACACANASMGHQTCQSSGGYGACTCTESARCVTDQLFACSCAGGALGAQRCLASGVFDACSCETPASAPSCVPGASAPCACTSGDFGAQLCDAAGRFAACVCEPASTSCVPGRSVACACPDGSTSAQVCDGFGTFASCACASIEAGPLDDASAPDAGIEDDASYDSGLPHVCDPWHGETCGCPEVAAPITPTLARPSAGVVATGTAALVDIFVTEGGIVVVDTGGATLLSRTGTRLATWTASRQLLSAAFDGTHLVIADAGAATTLDTSLTVVATALVTEACAAGVLDSCGHYVCGPSNDWDRIFYTYDALTGAALGQSTPYTYDGIPMRRVPGAQAFITTDIELSPTHMYFFRIGTDGVAVFGTDWPYHGDFPVNERYAFVGSPASHVVNIDGRLLRLDPCMNQPDTFGTGNCLRQDGALGTLSSGEQFVSMEGTSAGDLYAVVGASRTYWGDPLCAGGCRLQRIDVGSRRVSSETALGYTPANEPILRYDAWSGAVVLAGATSCVRSTYPVVCSGWTVRFGTP